MRLVVIAIGRSVISLCPDGIERLATDRTPCVDGRPMWLGAHA